MRLLLRQARFMPFWI